MSEKKQHNSYSTQVKMQNYYGDEHHHKHDKSHLTFRKHFKTHPVQIQPAGLNHQDGINPRHATGHVRDNNIKKIRMKTPRYHEHLGSWH